MGVQALLAVEEAMALVALEMGEAVAFIPFNMILAPFLETSPAVVSLVIRAGMLAHIIVAFEAVRAQVAPSEKTCQASQRIIVLALVQ